MLGSAIGSKARVLWGVKRDGFRRAILARLVSGEASVTQVAEPFEMSVPAISKHPEGVRWMFQEVREGGPAHTAGIVPLDLLLAINQRPIVPQNSPCSQWEQTAQ